MARDGQPTQGRTFDVRILGAGGSVLATIYSYTVAGTTVDLNPPAHIDLDLTNTLNSLGAGQYTLEFHEVIPQYFTGPGFFSLDNVSLDLQARADQTITFGALADKTFGDAPFDVSATANSGLPVSFSIVSGPATVAGSTITLTGAGTVTVRASQAGNASYNPAPDVNQSFTVNKAQASITLGSLTQTYDGGAKSASATTNPAGLAGVSTSYSQGGVPVTQPTNAGSYAVVASLTNPNYQALDATGTLVISPAIASVTLSNLNQAYDGSPKAASVATTPAGLSVSLTYDGGSTAPVNAGSHTVIATVTDPNYQGSATDTLVIQKAAASITLSNLTQAYDGSPKSVGVVTSPGGVSYTVSYSQSESPVAAPTDAGSYDVLVAVNDPNYAAVPATGVLVIEKSQATLTLGSLTQVYDGSPKAATVTTSPAGLAGVSISYSQAGGPVAQPINAGSYEVVASLTNPNYQAPNAAGTLVIRPATAQVTLSNLSQTYDGSPKAAAVATTPAGLNVSLTYDGSSAAPIEAGSYTVVATVNDPNYQGSATDTLRIAKATQSISFGPLSDRIYKEPAFTVSATASTGLPVSFSIVSGPATVAGSTVTLTGVGTVVVRASQAGDTNYGPAPAADQSFKVTYAWSGFLQPVNPDNTSVFKQGSTVPVKFQLTGASAGITNAAAKLYVAQISNNVVGQVNEAASTSAADTGNLFRYDPTSSQYIFNLNTKNLAPGTYQLQIDLGDGVSRNVNIGLR